METFFPNTIITYLELFAPLFGANNFLYFRGYVLGQMLLGTTRKCVTQVAHVCFFLDRHLSSWERFVAQYQWDVNALRRRLVELLKQELGGQLFICGAYLAWVDTTLIAKVKGAMPGVQKWHDQSGNPDRGERLVGHHWALVGLLGATYLVGKFTPLCWPLFANLIPGNSNPFGFVVGADGVAQALSFWDAVCPLIAQLQQMLGAAVPWRVVADAYFSKAPFINWMLSLKVQVITRLRHDAVGWEDPEPEAPRPAGQKKRGPKPRQPKPGRQWKLAELLKALPLIPVRVFIYGQLEPLEVVTRRPVDQERGRAARCGSWSSSESVSR